MSAVVQDNAGNEVYEEREAVAVFDSEAALNKAVDALQALGLSYEDMSLLADAGTLSGKSVKELEDADDVPHAAYVSPGVRSEGLAAAAGGPALAAGLGAAAVVASGGLALIPTIAVVCGSGAAAGTVGLLLGRAFGRFHAERVRLDIANGGILLWVHAPEGANDAKIIEALTASGARDVHFHSVKRSWGVAAVPGHNIQPDPLLKV
ncbi:hypothetical protein [Ancylobacter sp. G4_0304]|uniref:hypothetical protein n=1 Tax=Ancylobacter sp. G4_0304 TaxID=3114289 RepID=UPI0039C6ED92